MVDWSVLVSLWGVNDHSLCNWSLILRGWHFNFDVPNIVIPFREYVNDSFDSPVSTNRIGILHYDYLIHSHRILLSIPLLSWDQWRKHTSGLTSPEGVHYLLHQLDSMLGVPSFSERSMWPCWWGSSEKRVVGTHMSRHLGCWEFFQRGVDSLCWPPPVIRYMIWTVSVFVHQLLSCGLSWHPSWPLLCNQFDEVL